MKDKVLLYHKNCPDGYGSRWCFERKWGEEMTYIPVAHGFPPPEGLEDKDIWIADFSYSKEILLALKEKNRSITVIDHHKTAEDALKDLDFCHFDMSHCGSVLSWYYCNGLNKEPPLLLKYIEDQDLWKWQMPFAKEILSLFPPNSSQANIKSIFVISSTNVPFAALITPPYALLTSSNAF
jgi:hypothetical protein